MTPPEEIVVILDEEALQSEILSAAGGLAAKIGREGCAVLDFAFNLGGTEAVCESFYSVVEQGGSSKRFFRNSLLDRKKKVSASKKKIM